MRIKIAILCVLFMILLFVIRYYNLGAFNTKIIENYVAPVGFIGKIPKIVFRADSSKSRSYYRYRETHGKWVESDPTFSFIWFDNKQQETFMKTCPDQIYTAYRKLIPGAYRTDLWRLCILYTYGGGYLDAYCTPRISLEACLSDILSKKGKQFVSALDEAASDANAINNGVIFCEKEHPFILQTILDIVENVKQKYYGKSSLDPTGPVLLSKSIKKVLGTCTPHREGWNIFPSIEYFLLRHEYGPYQDVYKRNEIVMSKKYDFYDYLYRKFLDFSRYTKLWENRKIYRN